MSTIKIHTNTDKMHDCSSACVYVVVDNTNGDMRHIAYCSTRDMAHKMRETYCEDVLGIDCWENEDSAYIFIEKYNLDCLIGF